MYKFPEGLFWLVFDHVRYVIVKLSIQHVKISPLQRFRVHYLFKIKNPLIRHSTWRRCKVIVRLNLNLYFLITKMRLNTETFQCSVAFESHEWSHCLPPPLQGIHWIKISSRGWGIINGDRSSWISQKGKYQIVLSPIMFVTQQFKILLHRWQVNISTQVKVMKPGQECHFNLSTCARFWNLDLYGSLNLPPAKVKF